MSGNPKKYSKANLAWAGLLPGQTPRYGRIRLLKKHPFVKKLVGCWVHNEGAGKAIFNLVDNSPDAGWVEDQGTIQRAITAKGPCLQFSTGGTGQDWKYIKTKNFTFDKGFSFLSSYRVEDTTNSQRLMAQHGTPYGWFVGWIYNTGSPQASAGAAIEGGGDGTWEQMNAPPNTSKYNDDLIAGFTYKNSTGHYRHFTDGDFVGSGTRTNTGALNNNGNLTWLGADELQVASQQFAFQGKIYFEYLWNRTLTDEEMASLSANPNQIFEPVIDFSGYAGLAALDLNTSWHVLAGSDIDIASHILTGQDQVTGWRVLNSLQIDTGWRVFAVHDIDIASHILTAASLDTSWRVFTGANIDIAWAVYGQSVEVPEQINMLAVQSRDFIINADKRIFITMVPSRQFIINAKEQ